MVAGQSAAELGQQSPAMAAGEREERGRCRLPAAAGKEQGLGPALPSTASAPG